MEITFRYGGGLVEAIHRNKRDLDKEVLGCWVIISA